jgi:hypothetical protein
MAAKRGEETKTPLIVALVIFVILTIILGVGTYFGFAKQQELVDAAKKADTDAKAKASSRDWHRLQNELLKSYVGHPLSKEDQEHLLTQWQAYENNSLRLEKDDNRADFDKLMQTLNQPGFLEWDKAKMQPKKSLLELVKEKDQRITDLNNAKAQLERNLAGVTADLANAKKVQEESEKNLSEQLQKSKKETADLITAYDTKFKEYLANVENLHIQVDDAKRSEDKTKDDTSRQLAKLKKELQDSLVQLDHQRKKLNPPDVVELEKPKGRVVNVDRSGDIVYIDLGSADNVKPQLTFSIYSAGANLRGALRKGALEVTNVLAPHLSKARVTELTDPNLQPVVRGDLLYNAAWSPTMRQHVAIAGLVDLTGDANDDTPAFIRGLERLGIVVDSYIDLKDLKVKGPGMNMQTSYLIVGDEPKFNEMGVLNQSDVYTQRKVELNARMSEMQAEAKRLGIPVMPYRRFLTLAGYPTPRTLTTGGAPSSFLDSGSLGAGAAPKTPETDDKNTPKDK